MSYIQIFIHMVWATYQRQPLITPDIEPHMNRFLRVKCQEMGLKVLALNGMPDHVHLVVNFRASLSVSDAASALKGSSSHFINHRLKQPFR